MAVVLSMMAGQLRFMGHILHLCLDSYKKARRSERGPCTAIE